MPSLEERIKVAVRQFWQMRQSQSERQGRSSGVRDAGARAAVTGGAQMAGFVELIRELLAEAGLRQSGVHTRGVVELPGWFRAEKAWDLLIVVDHRLIASIEFKSQVGPSFGNNFNNRTEEALGSAADLWAAYREGAFTPSARPWLGYLMLLEDAPGSRRPVKVAEPHFKV
ncbi:MAG: PaeR7I family type II restriction endonuclease, partial [bacterium]